MPGNDIRISGAGDVLRRIREERGWTLQGLAKELGNRYAYSTLAKYERGDLGVTSQVLTDIARVAGMSKLRLFLECAEEALGAESEIWSNLRKIVDGIEP